MHETQPGEFSVLWKTPMLGDARLALEPEFSGDAKAATPVMTRTPPGAAIQQWTLRAPELRGQTLRIRGLEATMTDALARIEFADGTSWTRRLTAKEPSAAIPARQSGWAVAGVYLKLGVEHILAGIDHLLFVLALLIITMGRRSNGAMERWEGKPASVPTRQHSNPPTLRYSRTPTARLLLTVTAFTVAHSITLALATLGFVHVPQQPVEAMIALSIAFVASEIVRTRWSASFSPLQRASDEAAQTDPNGSAMCDGKRTEVRVSSLTARAPWVVAFAFGLLHGFGFAGALNEVGLPQGHIPVALLFFNVGVEFGQLLFIAAVLALIALGRQAADRFNPTTLNPQLSAALRLAPPYAIGGCAAFWVIQRIAAF